MNPTRPRFRAAKPPILKGTVAKLVGVKELGPRSVTDDPSKRPADAEEDAVESAWDRGLAALYGEDSVAETDDDDADSILATLEARLGASSRVLLPDEDAASGRSGDSGGGGAVGWDAFCAVMEHAMAEQARRAGPANALLLSSHKRGEDVDARRALLDAACTFAPEIDGESAVLAFNKGRGRGAPLWELLALEQARTKTAA